MTSTQAEGLPSTPLDAIRDEHAKDTPILQWPTGAAAKVAFVQHHVTDVGKTGYNPHFRFNYITEPGVIEVLRPLLRDLKLAVIPSPAEEVEDFVAPGSKQPVGRRLRGKLTVIDTEIPEGRPGYSLEAWFTSDGADASDKAGTKAQTMWLKYALQKLFLVPTEGIDDADASEGAGEPGTTSGQAPAPAGTPAQAAPAGTPPSEGPIGLERAKTLIDDIIAPAVTAGQLDGNQVKAKLAIYRVPLDYEGVAKLTEAQASEFFDFCSAKIEAGAKGA